MLVWGMATLQFYDVPLLTGLTELMLQSEFIDTFDAQAMSIVVWAIATLQSSHSGTKPHAINASFSRGPLL